jgi:hypothetical protein
MRIREVNSKDDMAKVIDDYITTGYGVKESGSNSALMQKKTWGSAAGWIVSIVVALLLSIPTIGFSLLILLVYPIYAHYTSDKVMVRIGEAVEQKAGTL